MLYLRTCHGSGSIFLSQTANQSRQCDLILDYLCKGVSQAGGHFVSETIPRSPQLKAADVGAGAPTTLHPVGLGVFSTVPPGQKRTGSLQVSSSFVLILSIHGWHSG